jgi:hypothetical protein
MPENEQHTDEPRSAVERLAADDRPTARPRRRGVPTTLQDHDRPDDPTMSTTPEQASAAGLYERLVDEIPEDELELARSVLELIRSRGRLGRLQARAIEGLEAADLLALRSALVHGRWALPAARDAERNA